MSEKILETIEEQVIINFTGKINVLNPDSKQTLGVVLLIDGNLVNTKYLGSQGIKAFYNLCIDENLGKEFDVIVEPEIIGKHERKIDHPFSVLKRRMYEMVSKYKDAMKNRPPNNLKLILIPDFIRSQEEVSGEEYSLMCTMSDYNLVSDIYKHSPLLDYEITNALVMLRKKNAIKVVQVK